MRKLTGFVFALFLSLSPSLTNAQEGAEGLDPSRAESGGTDFFSIELLAGTTAPIDVWGGARLIFFERLTMSASLGVATYGGAIGSLASRFGGNLAGQIVSRAFDNSLVARIGAGIRPFGINGPELSVSYGRIRSSANYTAADFGLPANLGSLDATLALNTIQFELGWSIELFGPLILRPALGWTQTLSSSASFSTSQNLPNAAQAAVREAESEAEGILERYGRTPTLSLSAGARF